MSGKAAWRSYLIVFVGSACTLIIELIAGRIVAPYVGVSLYTWTGVIGVVLAGISIGNYLGGKIADRFPSSATLGLILIAAGFASLVIPPAASILGQASLSSKIPLVPKITALTAILFFAPSLLLGMLSPIVIKLTLKDLAETGSVAGKIYAISTLGSIVGTYLTGFVLVAWLGTRTIVWAVALILIAMGIVFGGFWRSWRSAAFSLLVLAAYAYLFNSFQIYKAPCDKETNYYCIRVIDWSIPGAGEDNGIPVKALILDHLIHSYVSIKDPTVLGYEYEKIWAEVTQYFASGRNSLDTLFIGGGGYTFPRYIEAIYPHSTVEVVEIDPGVTQIGYEKLGLSSANKITTYNQDARVFVNNAKGKQQYDMVIGDAFNDLSVPYHLTTLEFNEGVRSLLKPNGVYLVNIIDNFQRSEFLRAYVRTLKSIFPYVYLLSIGDSWQYDGPSTYVVVASLEEINSERYRRQIESNNGQPIGTFLDEDAMDKFISEGRQVILMDNYVPVDNMVAPLFLQRGY